MTHSKLFEAARSYIEAEQNVRTAFKRCSRSINSGDYNEEYFAKIDYHSSVADSLRAYLALVDVVEDDNLSVSDALQQLEKRQR